MVAKLIERLLEWLAQLGRQPEPVPVPVRVTNDITRLDAIIAARRNARR